MQINNTADLAPIALLAQPTITKVPYALLPTARLLIATETAKPIEVRAVVDTGSQVNIICCAKAKRLYLLTNNANIRVRALGNDHYEQVHNAFTAQIGHRHGKLTGIHQQFLVLSQIAANQPHE